MPKWKIYVPFVVVVGAWAATWIFVPLWYPSYKSDGNAAKYVFESPGIFGDMFGAVNALFTGLAFAGAIVALILQTDQLKQQSNEQTELRLAMEQFAKSQTAQADALAELGMTLNSQNRNQSLAFRIQNLKDRLSGLEGDMPSIWTPGTPSEARRKNYEAAIQDIKRKILDTQKQIDDLG